MGGVEGLGAVPGLSLTPAGQHQRVVAMEDVLLLGMGPRLPDAVVELTAKLREATH